MVVMSQQPLSAFSQPLPSWPKPGGRWRYVLWGALGSLIIACPAAFAQGTGVADLQVALDTLWVLVAGFLVFFMNAGFCMLETGFCRSKNAVNLLAKNLIVFGLSTLAFWVVGFGLMFGDGNPLFGFSGFLLQGADNSPAIGADYRGTFSALSWAGVPLSAKFFFQLAFAGTAATIVSGAVAERIKFLAFFIFSLLLVGLSYPITGHWVWGDGMLANLGFYDFAGSTVVHSVGGWAALIGAMLLGPRRGRFQARPVAMPGHNLSISALGCLILWLGWFGFNPGSTMAADPFAISHIVVTTNIAAALGGLAATVTSWIYLSKPDLSMIINGVLAGLVAITASCAYVTLGSAAIIGLVAGVVVVFSVTLLDGFKVDDPVGAVSVHLVCGVWGTLALGLFSVSPGLYPWYDSASGPLAGLLMGGGIQQLLVQLVGIVAVGAFTVTFSLVCWLVLRATVGIRVSEAEEVQGLDLGEHAMEAYPEFQVGP
ncbi:ammonium transporter [Leptolyngbya sp. KIOST-1]|uniref:ammonium transporter n=1 Tax=Leptolyngbya sp. KIOST-1 TaxID=1229172 RepID=UPI00056913F5|nr:ammonium transporter [Leptolyngbya sp. KIOST-1]